MAATRPFLQLKARISDAVLSASTVADPETEASTVELPPGRCSVRMKGEIGSTTPLLAWLSRNQVEGRVIINTETGNLYIQIYLDE